MFAAVARAVVAGAILLSLGIPSASAAETSQIDIDRYLGTWFELARYDHFFERGCVGVTATYTKIDATHLRVVNECRQGTLDGKLKMITGKAWVPDPRQTGKLKVQFFWPFRSDYWVLDVAPDYSWALVGEPAREHCWILSRTPSLDGALYDALVKELGARGYDPRRLRRVPQAAVEPSQD